MFPLLGPMITGGASLLGGIFSSETSASNTQAQLAAQQQMQAQSEQFNAQQADLNRQFQAGQVQQQEDYATQMSNTAYQRASQDMQKAGLNPMMMFGSGSAASAPQGSTASGSTASIGTPSVPMPSKTSPFAGLGLAAANAVDTMVKEKQIDYLSSQVANTETRTKIAEAGEYPQARVSGMTANAVKSFMENHPDIAQAASVGPYLGQAIDKTGAPIFDALESTWGGLGALGRSLFGSSAKVAPRSVARGLSVPAEASSTSSANAVRRGMDLEAQLRDQATKSQTFKDWNAKIDAVREQFEKDNPGFVGEGR